MISRVFHSKQKHRFLNFINIIITDTFNLLHGGEVCVKINDWIKLAEQIVSVDGSIHVLPKVGRDSFDF